MRFIPLTIVLLLVFNISCIKDVEAPAGKPGTAGKNATPVVTIFTLDSTAWAPDAQHMIWETSFPVPELTPEVIKNSIIKVYMMRSTSWWELPYTENREALTQFGLEPGKLRLLRSESHGAAERPQKHSFKVVIAETDP